MFLVFASFSVNLNIIACSFKDKLVTGLTTSFYQDLNGIICSYARHLKQDKWLQFEDELFLIK